MNNKKHLREEGVLVRKVNYYALAEKLVITKLTNA